jgi:hypothetical protein
MAMNQIIQTSVKIGILWICLVLFGIALTPVQTFAAPWSQILDPSRAVDWSTAGIPGGIPNRTTICATLSSPGATTDATSLIQNALNSCATNGVVQLNTGTFRINSSISIPSNRVLRGSGPQQTILDLRGSGQAIKFGTNSPSSGTANAITAGANKDSTSITVSGSGIASGQLLMISHPDLSYMTPQGDNGLCDWCDAGWPGNMDSGQIVMVTNVSGSTVTFSPPLYITYTNPTAYRFNVGAINAGLENLKLYGNPNTYSTNIRMSGAYRCWVKNVESDFSNGDHLEIWWSLQNEVRNSYFHDGFNHGPGGTDNDLNLAYKTSATLVINNIFYRQHVSVMLEWGASGNVVAYNYSDGNYHQDLLSWMINDFNFHGAHPMMNLFEGNSGNKFQPDSTWGSSSHTTLFRNYFTGSRQYIPPMNSRGSLQPGSASWEDGNAFAYSIDSLAQFTNAVGNISGSAHLLGRNPTSFRISPASGGANAACWRIGYVSGNDSASNPNNADSTMFKHGMYDCNTGAITWDAAHPDHALPASFFLSSKPTWWGTAPWPAIGPDITGGNISNVNGHANKIPAQLCFENAPTDTNGFITFNPTACYPEDSSNNSAPPAPTGLQVQ